MRFALPIVLVLGVISIPRNCVAVVVDDDNVFRRGDANHSGAVDSSDVSYIGSFLYDGGAEPPCMNEADVDHDGAVTISDMAYLANWLFQGGSPPPAPGPYAVECSDSTEPFISCDSGCP